MLFTSFDVITAAVKGEGTTLVSYKILRSKCARLSSSVESIEPQTRMPNACLCGNTVNTENQLKKGMIHTLPSPLSTIDTQILDTIYSTRKIRYSEGCLS
jgi:hypothetical protein